MKQILYILILGSLLSTAYCALKDENTLEKEPMASFNQIEDESEKETAWNGCSKHYSPKCLKDSISKIFARLNEHNHLELFPGVSLAWNPIKAQLAKPHHNSTFENALVGKISKYLSSISLKIQLIDANALSNSKTFSDIFGLDTAEAGRKRKDNNGAIWAVAMVMGGSMLSMALAGVAAAAAKALTMSIVAAVLSALAALKGGGEKSTTYEVISRPVVSHAHTYSSEVQHEHGGHGHGHYKRSIDQADKGNILQNIMFRGYVNSQ